MDETTFFVQRGQCVVTGTRHFGDRREHLPGAQITLAADEAAPLLARGAIGYKPPVPVQMPPPGSNPAGIGLQPGADAGRRF